MALRLTIGILASVFVPLGAAFVVVGLVVDEPDRGSPEVFVYVGAPLLLAGLACGCAFIVLWRRERARRQRRRQGLRATADIVRADVNWKVRVNGRPVIHLTVRFSGGTVSGQFPAWTAQALAPGQSIEILYDPAEPTNFEPATSAVLSAR